MRWIVILLFCVLQAYSFPKKRTQVYMATIDLDTNKNAHIDPEFIPDIGSQLPPVKRNPATTRAPDYDDYEDYELTAKPEEVLATTTTASSNSPRKKVEKEHPLLDSQFKPHVRVQLNNQKSSGEIRDEVARLMGDLHREELTLRTTMMDMTRTTSSPVEMMLLGNETMFFSDEEGSGEMVEDQLLNATTPKTTRKPMLFTTLIQEVKDVPVTARRDPFAHLDYDLSDHSNIKKTKVIAAKSVVERKKEGKLHGGSVSTTQLLTQPTKFRNPKPILVSAGKPQNRKKTLRKMKKIERMRRVKNLNHRVRAQNRMRLRKVLSKMLFGPRDSDVTSNPKPKSTKLKFVGSDGRVTPNPGPFKSKNQHKKLRPVIDFQQRRDKRDTGAGGAWDTDTVPIEKSVIESIHFEPHPYYHLKEMGGRTQVEPSPLINEDPEEFPEENEEIKLQDSLPIKSGLVQVSLKKQPKRLRMVTLKSTKKVSKKEKNANGVALVVPVAHKPTMLELLIGDFLQRLPPTARSPYLNEEQWS